MKTNFVVLTILLSLPVVAVPAEVSDLQQSIVTALISATEDDDNKVRHAAYIALADQPKSDEIVEAFRRALDDDSVNVRLLALSRLIEYEGPTEEIVERLVVAIEEDKADAAGARNLLKRMGEPAVPRLFQALESKDANVRISVADILGSMSLGKHQKETVSRLATLLKDDNRDVRLGAVDSLRKIAVAESREVSSLGKYVRYATTYIRRYDSNKDGVLTEDEWSKIDQNYGPADQDKDGRITPVELGRFLLTR